MTRRRLALLSLLLLVAMPAMAYVRLRSSQGAPARWFPSQIPVSYVIHAAGSDDVSDGTDELAVRLAFEAWESVAGSDMEFQEVSQAAQKQRTDWSANDIHLVMFDETGESGLFPPASGIIALTPVLIAPSTGRILDADILLNGRDMTFAAGLLPGAFDIRDVVTHEVGHLVGLGHSGLGGATMSPYTTETAFNHRTLSSDDVAGLRAAYPDTLSGELHGSVRLNGNAVSGAHAWARRTADGRIVTDALTDAQGRYELTDLPPGTYEVVVAPLNSPLLPQDFAATGLPTIDTGFQPAVTAPVTIAGTGLVQVAPLAVPEAASLRVVGPRTARIAHQGESVLVTLTMNAFVPPVGVEPLVVPRAFPHVTIGVPSFSPPSLSFDVLVASDAPVGLYDLEVRSQSGARTIASGFLEVVPPAPDIDEVDTTCGSEQGGADVVLHGRGLSTVTEVYLGASRVTEASSLGDEMLSAVAPAHPPGIVDAVVVGSSGEEARRPGAFTFVEGAPPQLDGLFPPAGGEGGATPVSLFGSGFRSTDLVSIGGAPVASQVLLSPGHLRVVTPPLPAGLHDVAIAHSDCSSTSDVARSAFRAVAGSDPVLVHVTPDVLSAAGGDTAIVVGGGFLSGAQVEFFTDLFDGTGGASADTTYVSDDVLEVLSPAGVLGRANVFVRNPDGPVAGLADAVRFVPLLTHRDRLLGTLGPGSTGVALLDGVADTRLDIDVRRLKGGTLIPSLVLEDGNGVVLVSTDPSHPAFLGTVARNSRRGTSLRKFVLPATGRYRIVVRGLDGSAGEYRLGVRERLPKSALRLRLPKASAPSLGPGTIELLLIAKGGSRLSGRLKGRDGLQLRLVSMVDPRGDVLVFSDGAGQLVGQADVVAGVTLDAQERALRFDDVPLEVFGTYRLTIGAADGTAGPLVGGLAVKAPRDRIVFVE